jgi:hypothetical protein
MGQVVGDQCANKIPHVALQLDYNNYSDRLQFTQLSM